jgi:hypothetical protein
MGRKNSLLDISKAYEQILNEMNVGIPSSAQNPLYQEEDEGQSVVINNADDPSQMTFTASAPRQSAEDMAQNANAADINRASSCSKCADGQCQQSEEEEGQACGCGKSNCSCGESNCSCGESNCSCGEEEYDVYDNSNLEMAKSEVYKIIKCTDELMQILDSSPKMEAWMLSKLVKASDFVSSVKDVLDYDLYDKEMSHDMSDLSNGMNLVGQITSMLSGESKAVNEAVIKRARFNLEILKNK